MLGSQLGGSGLLGMCLLPVPVRGHGHQEEHGVDHHRGRRPVLSPPERRTAVDEVTGSLTKGPVVTAFGPHVGAGGPLEHEGRFS